MLFAPLEGWRQVKVTARRTAIDTANTLHDCAVLSTQWLNRRIAEERTLKNEPAAGRSHRNKNNAKAVWHFTTADAHVTLKSLYPALSMIQAGNGPVQ